MSFPKLRGTLGSGPNREDCSHSGKSRVSTDPLCEHPTGCWCRMRTCKGFHVDGKQGNPRRERRKLQDTEELNCIACGIHKEIMIPIRICEDHTTARHGTPPRVITLICAECLFYEGQDSYLKVKGK
jgi:hypothetical protein